ncbi:MAG: universal stress protein [Burkholderiales bacterium]
MARVLIPFSDPAGARRAVDLVLREARDATLSVHLLAMVEPRTGGRIGIFLTAARAEAMARDAARRWLAPLEAVLAAAGVAYTSEVATGPVRRTLRAATERTDVDRVLLPPSPGHAWLARRERSRIRDRSPHPVTLVA